ncbi:PsbP-related protein, partial [Actinomadura adrarensis]
RTTGPVTSPSSSAPTTEAVEQTPSDGQASGNENSPSPSPSFSLPSGLVRQDGPGGYTIGVPQGWTRQVKGNSVFWHDPVSEAYVQVDRTGWTGDPEQHWIGWEREVIAKNALPDYRRVSLTRTSVDGVPAADLEFTWTGKHGIDRGIVVDGRSYAVFVAVPESRWNQYRVTVNNVIDSFRP